MSLAMASTARPALAAARRSAASARAPIIAAVTLPRASSQATAAPISGLNSSWMGARPARLAAAPRAARAASAGLRCAASAAAGLKAADGLYVDVHYKGTLDDGTVFDSSEGRAPLQFRVGGGQVIKGFDMAVTGLAAGEERKVRIEPADAYGEQTDEAVITVPIDAAPEGLEVGQKVQLSNGAVATVTAMTDKEVTIDANHELAGKALTFEVTVVNVTDPDSRFPLKKSDAEWKSSLSDFEFTVRPLNETVLRMKGTEPPASGEYDKFYPEKGYFVCKGCENPLYSAQSKFNSGCGWPAYDKCFEGSVAIEEDNTGGMRRVEIMCANCGGHLGHVFEGERMTDTNERHCVNSVSVKFVDEEIPAGLKEAKVV